MMERRNYDLVPELQKHYLNIILVITSNIEETLINSDNVTLAKEVEREFLLSTT